MHQSLWADVWHPLEIAAGEIWGMNRSFEVMSLPLFDDGRCLLPRWMKQECLGLPWETPLDARR